MKKNKIIWAVDPFSVEASTQAAAATALQALARQSLLEIEPVYVSVSPLNENGLNIAKKAFSKIIRSRKIRGLNSLTVVPAHGSGYREMAEALVAHAKLIHADMMIASKRAKKFSRWAVGSFSETLLFRAGLPTLIVGPTWKSRADLKHILFATDFSPPSHRAFLRVVEFAKMQGAALLLYHKLERARPSALDVILDSYYSFENYLMERRREVELDLTKWASEARKAGVPTGVLIEANVNVDVAEAIVKLSEKRKMMIAIVAHSGITAGANLGSAARRIIRASERPVWVLSPEKPKVKRVTPDVLVMTEPSMPFYQPEGHLG